MLAKQQPERNAPEREPLMSTHPKIINSAGNDLSLAGPDKVSHFDSWVPMDLEHIDNWSPSLDIKILLRTVHVVMVWSGS